MVVVACHSVTNLKKFWGKNRSYRASFNMLFIRVESLLSMITRTLFSSGAYVKDPFLLFNLSRSKFWRETAGGQLQGGAGGQDNFTTGLIALVMAMVPTDPMPIPAMISAMLMYCFILLLLDVGRIVLNPISFR